MEQSTPHYRILIYKRTHLGDPEDAGEFGCHDCMGRVREYDYDAVIGVGSDRPDRTPYDFRPIRRRITWVGIGPHRRNDVTKRGSVVRFDEIWLPYEHFRTEGVDTVHSIEISDVAPAISRRMFGLPDQPRHVRSFLTRPHEEECSEAMRILRLARRGGLDPSRKRLDSPATKRASKVRRSCRKSTCRP